MRNILSTTIGILVFCTVSQASAASVLPRDQWVPQKGDQMFVDVQSNTGYLLHEDASYLPFTVATGQQKNIHYLGMTYFAGTPIRSWVARERKIQYDRVTFGASGRFFRLFAGGTTSTYYGIHSHRDVEKWLKDSDRYKSFGCIVVDDEIMDIIETTFNLNGKSLPVTTMLGPQKFLEAVTARDTEAQYLLANQQ